MEKHFPEAEELIRGKDNLINSSDHVYYELGRLNIPKINLQMSNSNLSNLQKEVLFLELFLRPFMYAMHISPNSKVVFQTNQAVLSLIEKLFYPYRGLTSHRLINKTGSVEYLTILDSSEIIKVTKILFYKRLVLLISDFLQSGKAELMLTIHPDEKKYYDETGLSHFNQIWVDQVYAPVAKALIEKNIQKNFMKVGVPGIEINLKVELALDTKTLANPHHLVIGQDPARALLQRLQSRLDEFGQN